MVLYTAHILALVGIVGGVSTTIETGLEDAVIIKLRTRGDTDDA